MTEAAVRRMVTGDDRRRSPPLSPVLLAGLALRPVPPLLLQPVLDAAMAALGRRHRDALERLGELSGRAVLIDPVDLPFVFVLLPDRRAPRLTCRTRGAPLPDVAAAVRGPLLVLIDLVEGRLDGDAAFFTRDLVVEGDVEAVVRLRNAIDSAEIRIVDALLSPLGPLAAPAERAAALLAGAARRITLDLEAVREAVVAPVEDCCRTQALRILALEDEVRDLRGEVQRLKTLARRRVPEEASRR